MSETTHERVIRLVREMRNKTVDRGCTPAEAAAFAAKAAEWVEKYQIKEAELRQGKDGSAGTPDIEVCENILHTGKRVFNPGVTQVVNGLALGMCCRVIMMHRWNEDMKESEAVYGITGDVLDADYVCQVATAVVPALKLMAGLEGAEHGYEKAGLVRWSNQYLTGAGMEIRNRLEKDRKERSEVKEVEHRLTHQPAAGAPSTALTVVTGETLAVAKRAAVAEAFKVKYPKSGTNRQNAERAAPGATDATTPLHVPFGMGEVVRLTGLSHYTLRFWCRRGWVKPMVPGRQGWSNEAQFSAWQAVGLAILAAGHRQVRTKSRSYIGRTSIIRAMEALKGLSDEWLLPEHRQGPRVAENVAAIRCSALTTHESGLTDEMYTGIARVLEALDRKATGMGHRVARRVSGGSD